MKHTLAALAILGAGLAHAGGEPVRLPGPGIELAGRLYRPEGPGPFPAIVMLHGCGGLWGKGGEPTASFAYWAEHFRARGYVALLLDSFGPRGEKGDLHPGEAPGLARDGSSPGCLCRACLAGGACRTSILGASTSSAGPTEARRSCTRSRPAPPGRPEGGPRFRAAVAFYPGCADLAKAPFRPTVPLLIQSGGADDWTPARHCEALAAAAPAGSVEIDVYPGAHHSFDRLGLRLRERPEVRNPNRPGGRGATVGTHPEAREKAIARTTAWLEARDR